MVVTDKRIASDIEKTTGLPSKDVRAVLDEFLMRIKTELVNDNEVRIGKFGKFYVNERSEREGYDPARKIKIPLGISKNPAFKAITSSRKGEIVKYKASTSFKGEMRKKILEDEGYVISL